MITYGHISYLSLSHFFIIIIIIKQNLQRPYNILLFPVLWKNGKLIFKEK